MTTTTLTDMDLGVQGLAAVKAELDRVCGPALKLTKPVQAEDEDDGYTKSWGKETPEELESKSLASKAARDRALDKTIFLREAMYVLIRIVLVQKLLAVGFEKLFGAAAGLAQKASSGLVMAYLYNRYRYRSAGNDAKGLVRTITMVPFFGGLVELAMNKDRAHDHLMTLIRGCGFQSMEIPVPASSFMMVMDSRDREWILKTNFKNYLKNRPDDYSSLEFCFGELLGRGIFATDKKEWQDSRKIASHMFSGQFLQKQMEDVFNKHANELVQILDEQFADQASKVIDMQEVFQSIVFDAFCEIAFGVYPHSLASAIAGRKPEFLLAFDLCQNVISERLLLPPLVWHSERLFGIVTGLGKEGEFVRALKIVDDYITPIIQERLHDTSSMADRRDLLSLYIKHGRDSNQPMMLTPEYLRDMICNFMIAGRDTSSCTMTYMVKFVNDRFAEELLRKNQGARLAENARITLEDSKTIPYADSIFNEVLRMAPPVGNDFRICVGDDLWPSGIKCKDGARVFISNVAIGRDPFLWKDADTFKPERWMRYENGVPQHVRRVDEYVHPVFFSGRRLCMGNAMARYEVIVFMLKLFNKFSFDVMPGTDEAMTMGPVIFLKGGLHCKIRRRCLGEKA